MKVIDLDYPIRTNKIVNAGVEIDKYFIDLRGKKILLYGDSISSTDYTFYKNELEELSNASVLNLGFSGYTTAQLATQNCLSIAETENPDVVLILVGGNDSGNAGTVGTFGTYGGLLSEETIVETPDITSAYGGNKFIEALSYITLYLTYKIGGFRHNAYLQELCSDVGQILSSENALDDVKKPLVVLCTTLPQQRSSETNIDELRKKNKRKADACREVAQLFNIPLLDFSTRAGLCGLNEPFWTSPTNKVNNKGTYTMDGLHPNVFGYRRMSRIVYDFLRPYFIV